MELSSAWSRVDFYLRQKPQIAASAFVAPGAVVIGAVRLGAGASVWYGAVVRADLNDIVIGDRSNVQDGCVLHVADDGPLRLGVRVSCGHRAVLHACSVGDRVLVGTGACLLDGAQIGEDCIIGAHALVTKGARVPPRSLVLGSPAKVTRPLTDAEIAGIAALADKYVEVARRHAGRPPADSAAV